MITPNDPPSGPSELPEISLLPDDSQLPTHVVGIGASAGGLEALERLFRAMPVDTGMAFVVIQHLSPDFKSLMNELLERFTSMAAIPVLDIQIVRPNTIYLLPPRKDIVIEGSHLISRDRPKDGTLSLPINLFFRSLAAAWGERTAAIVLSGTGSDGSNGLLDVRDAGGLVLAESPETARFDGMPQSAINTGCVDAVLAPEDMPRVLLAFASNPESGRNPLASQDGLADQPGMPAILELLRKTYHIDFSLYKPATIMRRIERRLALKVGGESIDGYSVRLARDPAELDLLYKDLLIGVTRFFRDSEAFDALRRRIIPSILDTVPVEEEIRIWVCGCSTGEEAYSIAILFLEACTERAREPRIKLMATDLHDESLQIAAEGIYAETSFGEMATDLRNHYFQNLGGGRYKVMPQLRRVLIFSEHNLLKDPPFTKLHLISCRNLLIYLQASAQARAIGAFYYSLRIGGALFLGASESLGNLTDEFEAVDRHWKIYRKVRESRTLLDLRSPSEAPAFPNQRQKPGSLLLGWIYDALLNRYIPSGFLVNERHELLHVFGDAAHYVQASPGRFSNDLLSIVSGNLNLAISTALRNARKQKGPVVLKGIRQDGEPGTLQLTVEPLVDKWSNTPFFMIVIEPEAAPVFQLQPEDICEFAIDSRTADHIRELETELQKSRESLQTAVEELETSNEELQASNEELLASNEELQSTNEELHSVNEELYSVNAEHELKIRELDKLSSDLRNLTQSTDTATLFLDNDWRIRLFTPRTLEIFNLMPQDIGRDLRHFRPIQPDEHLFEDLARVLAEGIPVERQVTVSDDRSYLRRCTRYQDVQGAPAGLVVNYMDLSLVVNAAKALAESNARFEMILKTSPSPILVVSAGGEVLMANDQAETVFGYPPGGMAGMAVEELVPDSLRMPHVDLRLGYMKQPKLRKFGQSREVTARRRDGTELAVEITLGPVQVGGTMLVVVGIVDVTERRRVEAAQQEALEAAQQLAQAKTDFLARMSHEIRTPMNAILGLTHLLQGGEVTQHQRERLGMIHTAARHLLSVINDVLDLTKIESDKLALREAEFRTADMLRNITVIMNDEIALKGLTLELDTECLPEVLLGDQTRLSQMLLNYLGNAVKFTRNGTISLSGRVVEETPESIGLRFEVRDSGPGIAEEHLPRLFTAFQQVGDAESRAAGGTGLGLAINRHLARLMNGEVGVESRLGQGCTFWFTARLPKAVRQPMDESPVGARKQLRDQQAGAHILLVEDDSISQMVALELLQDAGMDADVADNGEQALALAVATNYDLILMDMQMPIMDGPEACRRIRRLEAYQHTPILALTANAFREDRERCLEAGMDDHLPKPIEPDDLYKTLLRWLPERRRG